MQHEAHSSVRKAAYCFSCLPSHLWTERLGAHSTKCMCCCCVWVWFTLSFHCCVAIRWGGGALLPHTEVTKGPPGPLEWRGKESKHTQRSRREGPGIPFGMVGPLSWKPTRGGVSLTVLLPLYTAEEGCNNKTQANVWLTEVWLAWSLISLKAPAAVSWWRSTSRKCDILMLFDVTNDHWVID